ncbi:MAG: AraC family transcriptional regulator [Clostridia bacterium]|nr:AraC family transcriptional regulator [Clostridia bacterium]
MSQINVPEKYPTCFRGRLPELTYVGKRKNGDSFSPPRILHSHTDVAELLLITQGTANYTVGEHQYVVTEGDVIALNAGVMHDEDARLAANTTSLLIGLKHIQLFHLPDNALIPKEACPVLSLKDSFPFVQNTLETIYALLKEDRVQYAETCQQLTVALVSLFVELYRRHAVPTAPAGKGALLTDRIRKYIDDHYNEEVSLQAISDALHANSYYLAHVFKENTGYSPMQYAIRLRIGKAQELLTYTNYSVTQIAGMVGYDNISHFNAMFTKYIGMAPGKYRKISVTTE